MICHQSLKVYLKKAIKILIEKGHTIDYNSVSSKFDTMKNTFDAGIDD